MLIAELKQAQSKRGKQAEIQRILKELVALRAETFRYDPKPDAGGSGSGGSSSVALTLSSTSSPDSKGRFDGGGGDGIGGEEGHIAKAASLKVEKRASVRGRGR